MSQTLGTCKTATALLLVACEGPNGVFHFPSEGGELAGLRIDVKGGVSINEQLMDRLVTYFKDSSLRAVAQINQYLALDVEYNDQSRATLYVARIPKSALVANPDWPTLPLLLRAMPSNKNRIQYMKVVQALSGAMDARTKAVEIEDLH